MIGYKTRVGLPRLLSGEESAAGAGHMGSIPGVGGFHMLQSN